MTRAMAAAFSAALILQSATGAHGRLAKDQKIVSRAVSTKQLAMAQRNAMGEKKQALSGPAMESVTSILLASVCGVLGFERRPRRRTERGICRNSADDRTGDGIGGM